MNGADEKRNMIPARPEGFADGAINVFLLRPAENDSGELVGKWHAFPTTESALRETLRDIGVDAIGVEAAGGEVVTAVHYDTGLDFLAQLLPKNADLNELNYLAAKIDNMSDDAFERFEETLAYGAHTGSVKDLINLADNSGCYNFLLGTRDDETLGADMADWAGETADINAANNPLRSLEDSVEQNDNNLDGIINNIAQPTVAELESQVKAGQSISLMDLARATHADGKEKRPSVLNKLKQRPHQQENKTKAPEKSAEMEL